MYYFITVSLKYRMKILLPSPDNLYSRYEITHLPPPLYVTHAHTHTCLICFIAVTVLLFRPKKLNK